METGEHDEIELEWVLEFLRKNGLSECESALMDDVFEKSQLGSSDFEKFVFPLVPQLRIPATRHHPPEFGGDGSSKGSSDDDEFVSLDSSTTELYSSSDFTNPYGIRTTRPTSQASSDRLSQFGTARDYPDFDMQNDLFCYIEKDEDYAMPPLFSNRDFDVDPSEDKFITTVQAGEPVEDQIKYNFLTEGSINYLDNLKDDQCNEYYELRKSDDKRVGGINNTDEFNVLKKNIEPSENDKHDFIGDKGKEGGSISDELLMYDNKEDYYEIFSLRIIHRKNRYNFFSLSALDAE